MPFKQDRSHGVRHVARVVAPAFDRAHKSGPQEAVKRVVEGVKGKAKEVGGTVAGHDDLVKEGQAQQDKADAQRSAGTKDDM
jgi:uncharacterized protein YjbJ (UPF0337 family)